MQSDFRKAGASQSKHRYAPVSYTHLDVYKRQIRTWSNMPIIVISARSDDMDKIEALDAGADDYITKPFSVEELLARIRVSQRRLAKMCIRDR